MLDQLREERKDQRFYFWLTLEKAKAKLDPTAPFCHRTNQGDHTKWCDSQGPGGFMGHTCEPNKESAKDKLFWLEGFDRKNQAVWSPIKNGPTERVNHPAHYGGDTPYEAIKVIDAWELGFELGNTVKYIKRSGKDSLLWTDGTLEKRIEDLKKAEWYLHHKIEQLEKRRIPTYNMVAKSPISDVLCADCGKPNIGHDYLHSTHPFRPVANG